MGRLRGTGDLRRRSPGPHPLQACRSADASGSRPESPAANRETRKMNAARLLHSKRHPGEGRDSLFRVPCDCPVDSGFRRNDDLLLLRRFGERFGTNYIRFTARFLLIASLLLLSILPANAVRPDEMLADPALEARA